MLHRALITGIILFWAVMTGLLLRLELFPGRSDLLPVPINHVLKLAFIHQQPSSLVLYRQQQRLGNLHVQPLRVKNPDDPGGEGLNLLGFDGALIFELPGLPRSRATFNVNLELSATYETRRFEGTIVLPNPKERNNDTTLKFDGHPSKNQYHYVVRRGTVNIKENSGTLAALADDPDFQFLPVNPRALLAQAEASAKPPSTSGGKTNLEARRGHMTMNGEEMETYVVTTKYADSFECTAQISQLGQILEVKTFAGYNLLDDTIIP